MLQRTVRMTINDPKRKTEDKPALISTADTDCSLQITALSDDDITLPAPENLGFCRRDIPIECRINTLNKYAYVDPNYKKLSSGSAGED